MDLVLSQQGRTAVLTTPLGRDKLSVSRFDGTERISSLFEFRIEAASLDGDIDFDQLIGRNVSLSIQSPEDRKRIFDGILTETQWLGLRDHAYAYRLLLRPWLWLTSRRSDCFIFHQKSVTQIVAEVFGRHAYAHFEDRTSASYPVIEYCVQFRETDMAFVTRLMEEYGISWFFLHEEGEHKLVMADASAGFEPAPGGSRIYRPLEGEDRRDGEYLNHFMPARRFTPGRFTYRDYNFKTPAADMEADYDNAGSYDHAGQELYDYPGRYGNKDDGAALARVRQEEEEGLDRRCVGSGNCTTLLAGSLMTLKEHPFDYNKDYLVVSAAHAFTAQSYRSGSGSSEADYEGHYEFLDSTIPFRPAARTRKPRVHGPQTAMVVGASGEEIDCDEYGRILVRFHWDRKSDQSMRCRVAQNWASQQWGGMIIPRIGMEVVVEFLDGDPDRPLVTGAVYNARNMPHYALPANKTMSVFRTDSHKAAGFNEITFEDKGGAENMFFHAQKDQTTRVNHVRTARVDSHDIYSVGGNRSVEVSGNQKHEVGKSLNLVVGGTGTGALGTLMGVAGMAGNTASLMSQAGSIAGAGDVTGFVTTLASSALGFLGGSGISGRKGVVSGSDPGLDAGASLAASGSKVGKDTGSLIPMGGVMNTIVGSFQTTSVGVASAEQVGAAKVVNVGGASLENIGKFKKITVGDEFMIEVGQSKFIMRKDGTVIILGTHFNFTASGPVQINGKPIDLNKPGG